MVLKKIGALALSCSFALSAVVPQWHWESIDLSTMQLPTMSSGFRWGVALSEYQNSGADRFPNSNWAHFEKQTHTDFWGDVHSTIKTGEGSGYACNFWESYPEDIKLIEELGCNSLRISVEWTAIEPEEGVFSQEALDHYKDLIKRCNDAGIDVMVTIYHWTHPMWFEEKGGFENEENIPYFVRYCQKVFEALHDTVTLWCTINEIGSVVIQGYLRGEFPPGKTNPWTAMRVTRCMMRAHCEAYKALKQMPGGAEAQIGLVHAYVPFEPHDLGYDYPKATPEAPTKPAMAGWSLTGLPRLLWAQLNLIERGGSAYMSYFFNYEMLKFLRTGTMYDFIPGLRLDMPEAPNCIDFIGLNFYARVVLESNVKGCIKNIIEWTLQNAVACVNTHDVACDDLKTLAKKLEVAYPSRREHEVMSDMQYPVCPESLYCAIQEFSRLGKPIYITENGAPDGRDDRREIWIKRYLYALSEALKDGYDVRGYYYWSLMDNFEWNEGYAKKFGLYEVDFVTQKRTLRKGSYAYKNILEGLRDLPMGPNEVTREAVV